ncbi:DUF6531 domain-containing protein [Streptomyces sp. NPDC005898]|uniref:DUF6531 domain-containing protein n=1 Tax=Streptomyces sp. NPDC005898 TaxID=3157082 RepID=UPI003411B3C7
MSQRTVGARVSRARNRTSLATAAALATGALTLSLLPATAAVAADEPGSAWGKDAPSFSMPAVKVGSNKPVAPKAERAPSRRVAAWRAQQKKRAEGSTARSLQQEIPALVPQGQGDVPWHKISDFAITDALTARINFSTGNLMLAATDFSVAGVGQQLTLARTYNSLEAPWGKVSQRWWQQYERYLQVLSDEVVLYDASGDTLRFKKATDGSFITPKGYSKELKKNTDGTYTLTNWKSGSKDTYDEHGTLTKVTDKNRRALAHVARGRSRDLLHRPCSPRTSVGTADDMASRPADESPGRSLGAGAAARP